MSTKASPTVIGFFVLSAIFIGIASVLLFGGGRLTAKTTAYVAYFNEPLKGLEVGAPVTFRGVTVGAVTGITIVVDVDNRSMQLPVVFDIKRDAFTFVRGGIPVERGEGLARGKDLRLLIERGLRAQLQTESLVTGKKDIALDFLPDTPVVLVGKNTEYPEVPTVHSTGERLARTLNEIDLDRLAEDLSETLKGLRGIIENPKIPQILDNVETASGDLGKLARNTDRNIAAVSQDARNALGDARGLLKDVDAQVGPVSARLTDTLEAARSALVKADDALSETVDVLSEDSPMRQDVLSTVKEVAAAARSLRALAEYLERHPEALIKGKGGY